MDRKRFYGELRSTLSKGGLQQSQVDGIEAILDEWDSRELSDTRCLAYILATAWHETGQTMQPIEEWGKGRGKAYPPYYGRGHVQLTWERNYKVMSHIIGVDLVSNPALALDMSNSVKILFEGMIAGLFTGKKLADYFSANTDWQNARRIINGTDRAVDVAAYAKRFHSAILLADSPEAPDGYVTDNYGDTLPIINPPATVATPPLLQTKPKLESKIVWTQIMTIGFALFATFGIDVPLEFQQMLTDLITGLVTGSGVLTIILRLFFTKKQLH